MECHFKTFDMQKLLSDNIIDLATRLLPEVKTHLRVVHTKEDDLIKDKIVSAIKIYQDYTDRVLTESKYIIGLDSFPSSSIINISPSPLKSVESIKVKSSHKPSEFIPMLESNYVIDDISEPARIQIIKRPNVINQINAIKIEYVVGENYSIDNLPKNSKAVIMLMCGHLYENREEVVTGTIATQLPMAAEKLIAGDRV